MIKFIYLIILSIPGSFFIWLILEGCIKRYIRNTLEKINPDDIRFHKKYLGELPCLAYFNGYLELLLYSIAFFFCKPEFIIVWIGFKTALRWDRMRKIDGILERNETDKANFDYVKTKKEILFGDTQNRGIFLSFLIGTALNIIFAIIIIAIIKGDTPFNFICE